VYNIVVVRHIVYSKLDYRLNHITGGPLVFEI